MTAPPPPTQATPSAEQTANHVPVSVTPQKAEPAVHSTTLTHLSTLGTSPAPSTTRPSAQVSPYNSSLTSGTGASQVHSVINVDAGTSARGQMAGNTCTHFVTFNCFMSVAVKGQQLHVRTN